MDHPCHKCGHSMEDGKAFCPQCGAPQIRVAVVEPPPPVSVDVPASHSVLPLDSVESSPIPRVPALLSGIEWPRALRICALAALISMVVMSLRLMVPPLAMLGAGCLAVILYRRGNPTWRGDARAGAQLGAVTGLVSSGICAIFFAIFLAVLHSGGRQQMIETLQQLASQSHDAQVQAFLDVLRTPEGLTAKLAVGMVSFLFIAVGAGSVAGALTGAFLGRQNRP